MDLAAEIGSGASWPSNIRSADLTSSEGNEPSCGETLAT